MPWDDWRSLDSFYSYILIFQFGFACSLAAAPNVDTIGKKCLGLASLVHRYVLDGDDSVFSEVFQDAQPRLESWVVRRFPVNAYEAEEVVQLALIKVANREVKPPEDAIGDDSVMFYWMRKIVQNELRKKWNEKNKVRAVHLTNLQDDPSNDVFNLMDNFTDKDRSGTQALHREDIRHIPNRAHQLLLIRILQGKSAQQIAEELGVEVGWIHAHTRAAFEDLRAVRKGTHDFYLTRTRMPKELVDRIEQRLLEETRVRPAKVPEGSVMLTEEHFLRILRESPNARYFDSHAIEVARLYFVEGLRPPKIDERLGIHGSEKRIAAYLNIIREKTGKEILDANHLWIVDEEGVLRTSVRGMDYATAPKQPYVIVAATDLAQWIQDLPLKTQQIIHMRYVDGLSKAYIQKALAVSGSVVSAANARLAALLEEKISSKVNLNHLVIEGKPHTIRTEPVEFDFDLFIEHFLKRPKPNQIEALDLLSRYTGMPLDGHRLIVLTRDGKPIFDGRQPIFETPPKDAKKVGWQAYQLAYSRMDAEVATIFELRLLYGWSQQLIAEHLGKDRAFIHAKMQLGMEQLRKAANDRSLKLDNIIVSKSVVNPPSAYRISGPDFMAQIRSRGVTRESTVAAIQKQDNRASVWDNIQLVGADGKALHKGSAFAEVPENSANLSREDFRLALQYAQLDGVEREMVALRFEAGLRPEVIAGLLGTSLQSVDKALGKGARQISRHLSTPVLYGNLRIVDPSDSFYPSTFLKSSGLKMDDILANLKGTSPEALQSAIEQTQQRWVNLENVILVNSKGFAIPNNRGRMVIDTPKNPTKTMTKVDFVSAMERAKLSDPDRDMMRLRYEMGLTVDLTARVMGISETDLLRRIDVNLAALSKHTTQRVKRSLFLVSEGSTIRLEQQ